MIGNDCKIGNIVQINFAFRLLLLVETFNITRHNSSKVEFSVDPHSFGEFHLKAKKACSAFNGNDVMCCCEMAVCEAEYFRGGR